MTMRARIRDKKITPTGPIWLPEIRRMLMRINDDRYDTKTCIVAAGGKIVPTDGKDRRLRWNDWGAANMVERSERQLKSHQRYVRQATQELTAAKAGLDEMKGVLAAHRSVRDSHGRSTMRLDHLRSWVGEHMPSIREIATDGATVRFRFCASVMRGGGRYDMSPNRYVLPAMWIGINVDRGIVVEAKSDGCRSGALHPHAREDDGNPCTGSAVFRPREDDRNNMSLDIIKLILAGIEKWRLFYGDDHYHRPRDVARKVWKAVATENAGIAPIQGTSGRVYEDLDTLLRAEPWDGSVSEKWCYNCEVPYEACGCCADCDGQDGECDCGPCDICGRADCCCCMWCEDVEARWGFRGLGNEHEVCLGCGYCRLCDTAGATNGLPGCGSMLTFLTETDVARIAALSVIEEERGSHRPGDYSEGCNCPQCRAHTRWLNRQG